MNSSVSSHIVHDVLRGDASLMAEISTVPHQELFAGRMDEIGDIVDGELRPEEIDELLGALQSPT